MTKEELMELLDIEGGADFTYYENIADLLEAEIPLDVGAVFNLLEEVDMTTFAELTETYFYDIMDYLPGDDVDLYNIFESVKRNFIALSESYGREGEEDTLVKLAEEIDKFHEYYSLNEKCEVRNRETGERSVKCLRDAIGDNRLANMDNRELDFKTDDLHDYVVDEYIFDLRELSEDEF